MTPNARIAAAIEILDRILAGEAPEKALSGWARGHRFAGSKDRAGLRDLVFDALRCQRSFAALGGSETGRGLMIGSVRHQKLDPESVFTGIQYAPAALNEAEKAIPAPFVDAAQRLDCPEWLYPLVSDSLGKDADNVLAAMQVRAPVFVRVNLGKTTRETAQKALAEDGVESRVHDLSPSALEVTEGARRVRNSRALAEGLIEMQDAASQAVSDAVPMVPGGRMLDYCAGGGGKSLAVAARVDGEYWAHDINPRRMTDLPQRAARAGVKIQILSPDTLPDAGLFDVVLVDAPCSGSGSWRRDPHGKWALSQERLDALLQTVSDILDDASKYVKPGGHLVFVTCSLLDAENSDQIRAFLDRSDGFQQERTFSLTPLSGGDGFFFSDLTRAP